MPDGSSLGVTPASGATSQVGVVYNAVFPTRNKASFIGGLSNDKTDINVLSQLDKNINKNFYTFNFEAGSAIKLAFNSTVGTASNTNGDTPGTTTDGVSAGLRFQLYDITGNLVADSAGTTDQQTAYANLTSSDGLTAANGGYTVQISGAPDTTISSQKSYNFQLFSGTTYDTSLTYSAQTQSYDPNLFVAAKDSVVPSQTSVNLYTNAASLSGNSATALNIGSLEKDKTDLAVNSQINSQNKASFYKFDFKSGEAIKLALNNTSAVQTQLRVQLFDNNGKVLADSSGTDAQQEAYTKLASGEGLAAANGTYSVKISSAPNVALTTTQKYSLQLYSGTTFDTTYLTTAKLPSSFDPGKTPDVGIFANSQAQLLTRQDYHTIGETASDAVNAGYLAANSSALNVVSQLTHVDNKQYYSFTLQQGSDLKLAFENQTNTAKTRLQLLDPTGTQVIADNYGSEKEKQAFADLTSTKGLKASPAQYVVQLSFAPDASTLNTQTYNFQVYSGSNYVNVYKTTASAQTYRNAVLSGNSHVTGYNPATTAANYFNNYINGNSQSILDTLSSLV